MGIDPGGREVDVCPHGAPRPPVSKRVFSQAALVLIGGELARTDYSGATGGDARVQASAAAVGSQWRARQVLDARYATLTGLAERLAELDGLDPSSLENADAVAARVDQLVGDLVEPARVKALDDMGEGRRALSIAIRCLEPKLC